MDASAAIERTLGALPRKALSRSQQVRRMLDGPSRTWVLLVLSTILPLLLFGGWVAYIAVDHARADSYRAASATVDRVAERVAAELGYQLDMAQALAASAALDHGDLQAFRLEAERLKGTHPVWHTVELVAASGDQVLNLLRPPGEELGRTADYDSFERAVRSGQPAIGGLGPVGPVSGQRLVSLRVSVVRGGALRYVLSLALAPDGIGLILRNAGAPTGWMGAIVDADGRLVACREHSKSWLSRTLRGGRRPPGTDNSLKA